MSDSKIVIGIFILFAFASMICLFAGLYPGSMTRNTTSKLNLLWRFNSWKSFAISMESFPPEIQTAILSPSFTSSYSRTARVKRHQIVFRNFLRILCSISTYSGVSSSFWASSFCFMDSISHAKYPPFRLRASTPASCSASAAGTLISPFWQ